MATLPRPDKRPSTSKQNPRNVREAITTMTGNNLELALVLKVAQTGLENLTELIDQLKQAGYETATFEDHADQLNAALKQFESDSGLADELRDIARAADRADDKLEELSAEARTGKNSHEKLADSLDDAARAFDKADGSMSRNVRSHKKVSEGVESISTQLDRLQKLAGVAFVGNLLSNNLQDIIRLTDGYTNLNSRLELAVGRGKDFEMSLQSVRDTANATGNSLESVGDLYTKISRATNLTAKEVAALTNTISQSFVVSGASATEADATITQLSQALASGVLRGDEFNSVMEQSPRLSQALADSLGVTRGELRGMAEDGRLTTETVVTALQQQAAAIDAEFQQMPETIGRATQRLANEWQIFLGELNSTSGASELAVSALNGVAENLDSIAALVGNVAQVGAAALVVKFTPAVIAATKEMLAAAASGKLFAGALSQVGGAASGASRIAGLLKGALATAITTFVIEQALNLASAYKELNVATKALVATEDELAQSNARLADAYQEISDKTGVTVSSMAELEAALASGRLVIDEQTGAYLNAAQAAELKAQRDRDAADAATQMAYSQGELSARFAETNKQLQVAIDDNSKLAGVMKGSLLDALKNGETGIAAFTIALRNAQLQGQLTQQQIDTGLGAALAKLSDSERTRFGDVLQTALSKVKGGADSAGLSVSQLQSLLDQLNASAIDQALQRLGVSQAQLTNSITAGTQQALADLDVLRQEITSLGVSGEQTGIVLEAALVNAWRNAKTEADRAALTQTMDEFRNAGVLTTEAYNEVTKAVKETGKQAKDAAESSADSWTSSAERIRTSAAKANSELNNLGDTAVRSEHNVQQATASLAAWFQGIRNELAALSEQARAAFDNKLGISTAGPVSELDALKQSIAAAREELGKVAIDNLQVFDPTGVNRFKNSVIEAKNETLIAFQEQKIKALDYINALESGKGVNQAFINQAINAQQWMKLLGEEDLSQLQSAIDSANQKLLTMTNSAKSTLSSLQDELDRLQGNQEAIDKREYENKKAELSTALEEARRYGNQEAIKFYSEALSTLDKVRSEKQKQQRADAQLNNTRPAGVTSETRRVIELQLPSGKAADITVASEQDGQRLLDTLEEFAKRSR